MKTDVIIKSSMGGEYSTSISAHVYDVIRRKPLGSNTKRSTEAISLLVELLVAHNIMSEDMLRKFLEHMDDITEPENLSLG